MGRDGPLGCRARPGPGAGAGGGARPRGGGDGPADAVSPGAGGARSLSLGLRANSVAVALCVTLGSLVLGIGLARIVVRWRFWGRPVLAALTLAPLVVPPLFGAIGLRRLAGALPASGWLAIGSPAGWIGWVWVALASGVPLVALATAAALKRSDPAWEDAARLAGSTDRRTWWQLIWPGRAPECGAGRRCRLHADPDRAGGAAGAGLAADPVVPDRRRRAGTRACPPRRGARGGRGGVRGGRAGALPLVGPGWGRGRGARR